MPPPDPSADQARAQIEAALGQIGFCLPGTITIHRTRCGKPRCACAADPVPARPLIQWTRTVHGTTVTRPVPGPVPGLRALVRQHPAAPRADRRTASPVPGGNGQGRRLAATITPRTTPRPAPSSPRSQTRPYHPKRREISPPNAGSALQEHPVTAGQQGSVAGPPPKPPVRMMLTS